MKNKYSENYQNLINIYADMHNNGTIWDDAESTFDGKSLKYFFSPIKQIIDLTKSKSLIDFGCGKAKFYFNKIIINQIEYSNVIDYYETIEYATYIKTVLKVDKIAVELHGDYNFPSLKTKNDK